ncbi:MAG: hypothetical protein JW983_05495 [Elusimicrobia bacterium]|nr:hypothetical protein [Elusimicrobiota bacterium]
MIKYEPVQVQSILNHLDERSEVFSDVYTLNPYKGCEHACQYCYVTSDKYIPYKKKEEFFCKIQSKTNASFLTKISLQTIPQDCLIIVGSACDPYQPIEKKYKNTRSVLEILCEYKNPVHIMTKSDLILRDTDLLSKITSDSFLAVSFSIAMDDELSKIFEPRSSLPSKRFKAINILSSKGIRCGVTIAPILPYIVREKLIRSIILKASDSGAKYIFADNCSLRDTNKIRFLEFIKKFYPKLIHRYEIMYSKSTLPPAVFSKKMMDLITKLADDFGLDTTLSGMYIPDKKQLELFDEENANGRE